MTLVPKEIETEILEIGELPLYNQDYDDQGQPPAQWVEFREKLKKVDAVLFVTPEYNRSVPGVLKNAIDVGSRPYGQSSFEKKPSAIMTVAPGALGGFGANQHLRQSMVFLNMPCMQQPEAYIGNAAKLFDALDGIHNETTREFLQKFMTAFVEWIQLFDHKEGQSEKTGDQSMKLVS